MPSLQAICSILDKIFPIRLKIIPTLFVEVIIIIYICSVLKILTAAKYTKRPRD